MKKKFLFLAGIIILAGLILHPQQEVYLRITEGMPVIPLAIPEFIARDTSPKTAEAAKTLREVLTVNLAYSRVYSPLPQTYYSYIRRLDPDNIVFKDWESIQARYLLVGEVSDGGGEKITFEAKIYDVKSARFIFGKRYQGESSLLRLIAHKIADELLKIRGEPAVFTTRIVFVSNRDGNDELYWMDYDGHNQERLTFNRVVDYMPAFSADGRQIAYTSYQSESAGLYILKPYEGKRERVTLQGTNFAPGFSPDGKKLAFSSTAEAGNSEIYIADSDGKSIKRLTFNRASDLAPSWSPTSRQIAFTSDRDGTPQIYTMDAEGSNVKRISFGGSYHDSPAWSPDGDRISYVSRVNMIFDIYVLNLRTQKIIKLTEGTSRNESPCWSPDGRHLVFSSDRTGNIQLYTIDYDGSNLRRLTSQGANKLPDWSRR